MASYFRFFDTGKLTLILAVPLAYLNPIPTEISNFFFPSSPQIKILESHLHASQWLLFPLLGPPALPQLPTAAEQLIPIFQVPRNKTPPRTPAQKAFVNIQL